MKNEIENFPQEVIDKMLERQVEQGNPKNIKTFIENKYSVKHRGGFNWKESEEGHEFWAEVIVDRNFDLFFEKYPKQSPSIYPKLMMVDDNPITKENTGIKRVVFMEKNNRFLAWADVDSFEEAEKTNHIVSWNCAIDIPSEEQEETVEELLEKLFTLLFKD